MQLAGDGPDRVAGHRRGYFRSLNLIDTARRGYARVLLMESGGDAPESKSALRARMRRLMRGCVADSAPQCRELDSWLASHPAAETIAAYYPLPGEVDFTEIVRLHGRRRWVYPRVNGDEMVYHLVNDPDKDLTTGAPCPARGRMPSGSAFVFRGKWWPPFLSTHMTSGWIW